MSKKLVLPVLSLFTSISTLICCALPALLVFIGAGAVLAGLVSSAPWLVTFTKYKIYAFLISGLLLLVSGIILFLSKNLSCPTDPKQAKSCMSLRKYSLIIYFLSLAIYFIGFFFAFIAVHIFF